MSIGETDGMGQENISEVMANAKSSDTREGFIAVGRIEALGATVDYMDAYRRGCGVGRDDAMRELAEWMIGHSYATGHGDSLRDMLGELSWQINERVCNERADLLAALKEIECGCVGFQPGHVNYHQNRTKAQIAEIARAAISKATEQTP